MLGALHVRSTLTAHHAQCMKAPIGCFIDAASLCHDVYALGLSCRWQGGVDAQHVIRFYEDGRISKGSFILSQGPRSLRLAVSHWGAFSIT